MKLYETLEQQLKKEPNFVTDNGELKKWVVLNKAQNFDEELIGLLLDNADLKEKFFVNVKDTLVFNQNLFVQFLEQKNYLNDSYTQYKNKVGLTIGGKYLKQRNEVALVWPFKDCILEGGQSREEDKREEIFFNEILAQDEITQLLEPKVLTNAKRIDKDGEKTLDQFNRDAERNRKRGLPEDTITDNLIIKGNNLLALHSLKKEFAGKVKLIYIDPPYNTGGSGDTFAYNNSFKRSTWLTFMYNRLIAAKDLLRKDGVLIVAIDENEQPHLGVMLKELFKDYEVHCITIVHNPRGIQGTNFSYTHEYAFFVFPSKQKLIQNRKIEEKDIDWRGLRDNGGESLRTDAKNCFYPIIVNKKNLEIVGFGEIVPKDVSINKRFVEDNNHIFIYPVDNDGIERKWRYARQSIEEVKDLLRCDKVRDSYDIKIGKDFGQYRTVWIDPRYDSNEYGKKLLNSLVPNNPFSYPKSIWNVYDCIYAVVGKDKDAIVLDYHAGSGTTAHAVLELNKEDGGNRQFIMVEQMDYIETVTCKRVQKVIEQNGNSSFIYLELKKYNQAFIEQIEVAKDTETLLQIWEQMKAKSFLNYNVDIKKQEEHIDDFKALSLKEQKQHLCELLDKNQLYVN
ncbi:MAG TPA: site-specific DNA-methyltransferase, partial [Salinivirgaceae bacterium]|nr:site-specific DNA-methyltransferase [Salinivirgaceae bacterium]